MRESISYPQLDGVYFYADYCTGRFYAAVETDNGWENVGVRSTGQSISSFGEDEAGELYFTDHGDGVTYRITADVPPPSLSRLSPTLAVAGGGDLVLTLAGLNFVPASQVHWNGEPRPTTFLDSRRLQVAISGDDIATAVTAPINVRSPSPGGDLSEALDFEVLAEPILETAINDGGVVEAAASNPAAGVAAGSIASVYGADLAVRTELAFVDPLPTTLGGAALRAMGCFDEGEPMAIGCTHYQRAFLQNQKTSCKRVTDSSVAMQKIVLAITFDRTSRGIFVNMAGIASNLAPCLAHLARLNTFTSVLGRA